MKNKKAWISILLPFVIIFLIIGSIPTIKSIKETVAENIAKQKEEEWRKKKWKEDAGTIDIEQPAPLKIENGQLIATEEKLYKEEKKDDAITYTTQNSNVIIDKNYVLTWDSEVYFTPFWSVDEEEVDSSRRYTTHSFNVYLNGIKEGKPVVEKKIDVNAVLKAESENYNALNVLSIVQFENQACISVFTARQDTNEHFFAIISLETGEFLDIK